MPRSKNRRQIELPLELYATLEERATREGRPVAAVAADLITDGMTLQEWYPTIDSEVRETRRETRDIRQELHELRIALENRLPPWPLPTG